MNLEYFEKGIENTKRKCNCCGNYFSTGSKITNTLDNSNPRYTFVKRKTCSCCDEK